MSPRVGLDVAKILKVAIDIADREGCESVTLATVSQKIGVRSPSLYNHIGGLPDLRKKLAFHGLTELHKRMSASVSKKSRHEAIHALADAYLSFAREHPGVYELTLAPDLNDRDIQDASENIVKVAVSAFKTFDLTEEECLHAVRGIRSLLHGFASLEKNQGFGLPLSLSESFEKLIHAFLSGIHTYKEGSEPARGLEPWS
jgi:AcrR family transcriptional regulator